MHQIKSSSHTQNSTTTIYKDMFSNSLPKQSASHHRPFISTKPHTGTIGNEHADVLAGRSIKTKSGVADISKKEPALRELPACK
jgi:ribonuclease HI